MTIIGSQNWRIDYVKLLWRRSSAFHAMGGEQDVMRTLQTITANNPDERQQWSLNVLGCADPKDAYIVIDVWGKAADDLLWAMPDAWYAFIRRLDVRTTLMELNNDQARSFAQAAFWKGAHGVNMALLDSRPRHKNAKRDVGGIGVVYGSRKSARHMVIYKRGNEPAALEFRLQDKAANELAAQTLQEVQDLKSTHGTPYQALLAKLVGAASVYLTKVAGFYSPVKFVETMVKTGVDVNEVREAMAANKAAEHNQRDFWNMLAEEAPNETGAFELVEQPGPCAKCGHESNSPWCTCYPD